MVISIVVVSHDKEKLCYNLKKVVSPCFFSHSLFPPSTLLKLLPIKIHVKYFQITHKTVSLPMLKII